MVTREHSTEFFKYHLDSICFETNYQGKLVLLIITHNRLLRFQIFESLSAAFFSPKGQL